MISMVRSGSSRKANPRSIVMPRAFSSGSRSVSIPVSAFTSDVLPWSMWPAVPTTTCREALPSADGTGERPREGGHFGREDRATVEQQAVVGDAPGDRGRRDAQRLVEHPRRDVRAAHGHGGGGEHHGGQRPTAHLRLILD